MEMLFNKNHAIFKHLPQKPVCVPDDDYQVKLDREVKRAKKATQKEELKPNDKPAENDVEIVSITLSSKERKELHDLS